MVLTYLTTEYSRFLGLVDTRLMSFAFPVTGGLLNVSDLIKPIKALE